jgi:hypothetical protein
MTSLPVVRWPAQPPPASPEPDAQPVPRPPFRLLLGAEQILTHHAPGGLIRFTTDKHEAGVGYGDFRIRDGPLQQVSVLPYEVFTWSYTCT